MHRLFVALRPPRAMRGGLLDLAGGIAGARWQDDDQLHLTLRFIGEVDARLADDIVAALARVRHPRVALALAGLGRFDRRGRIDSLWAGVAPHAGVAALHSKLDAVLVRSGLAPDGRAYLPHITIARFGRAGGSADAFLAAHAGLAGEPAEFTHFCLYESRLGRDGARYTIVERYPLD